MLKIIAAFTVSMLVSGCGPAQFNIIKSPKDRTADQQTLDSTQCSQQSQVSGPWLYGIGTAIYHSMTKSRYQECMTRQGYEVKEKD